MASKAFFFDHVVGKVINFEGGLSRNPDDHGNWSGGRKHQGQLRGTKYGISAASYPELDIGGLTKEQAARIYYEDYWLAIGCDHLTPAMAFLHFDSAVNHGIGQAPIFLEQSDGGLLQYISLRLFFYANLKQFFQDNGNPNDDFGRGWTRRMAGLIGEIGELAVEHEMAAWKHVFIAGGKEHVIPLLPGEHVVSRVAPDRQRIYTTVQEAPDA